MASKTPVFGIISWPALLFNCMIILGLLTLFSRLEVKNPGLISVALYLVLLFMLRILIPRDHRKGISYVKEGNYEKAIGCFEKSYDFFTRNLWVDKYRFATLLSASRMSYREMALNNIAFCYGHLGNEEKSIDYYNRTLKEYPKNAVARAALNLSKT